MTIEEFVAEMKQAPHAAQTPTWLAEQQAKAVEYGFTWEAVCQLIRDQASVHYKDQGGDAR